MSSLVMPPFSRRFLAGWADVLTVGRGGRFGSIGAAISASQAGQTILVLPGVYDEYALSLKANTSLVGIDRRRCVIRPTSLVSSSTTVVLQLRDNCIVSGLTISTPSTDFISGTGYVQQVLSLNGIDTTIEGCCIDGGVDHIRVTTSANGGYHRIWFNEFTHIAADCISPQNITDETTTFDIAFNSFTGIATAVYSGSYPHGFIWTSQGGAVYPNVYMRNNYVNWSASALTNYALGFMAIQTGSNQAANWYTMNNLVILDNSNATTPACAAFTFGSDRTHGCSNEPNIISINDRFVLTCASGTPYLANSWVNPTGVGFLKMINSTCNVNAVNNWGGASQSVVYKTNQAALAVGVPAAV